jgi:two-component system, OmpR family, KDP operon response regulator KdpE
VTAPQPVVLVVEDEQQIRRFVRTALEGEGCRVHECESARSALIDAGTRKPDLVILDLGLPDADGVAVIRDLRAWSQVPVLVLSARSEEREKIRALDSGADDYLTKPFGVGELLARVRALLRRRGRVEGDSPVFEMGEMRVDLTRRVVERDGQPVHLTPIEYRLLSVLIANAGKVLTHRQLLKDVWGPAYVEHSHYLRIYMGQLRHKLERDPTRPRYLLTELGVGYRLAAE